MASRASEVATALRALADRLDTHPDLLIGTPRIWFYFHAKETFTNMVRLMPRPLKKTIFMPESQWPDLLVDFRSKPLDITATIPKSLSCTLIEPARPAVYRCDPVLSPEEDAEMVGEQGGL